MSNTQRTLIDKIAITAELELLTGMHIGASNDFAPIGAVDSVIVRDPLSKQPIIPGSSLKGKMRTLLAKTETDSPIMKSISDDSDEIKRLFGASSPEIIQSRLQFYDLFLTNEKEIELKDTDLYLTEIKFENTISRTTAVANPRQIERVPAGAAFKLNLIYNFEEEKEITEDFNMMSKALKLLQMDYIGGSGTRGYGKVKLHSFNVEFKNLTEKTHNIKAEDLQQILKGAEEYALLPV